MRKEIQKAFHKYDVLSLTIIISQNEHSSVAIGIYPRLRIRDSNLLSPNVVQLKKEKKKLLFTLLSS